jgi:hypothetical protein
MGQKPGWTAVAWIVWLVRAATMVFRMARRRVWIVAARIVLFVLLYARFPLDL